MIRSQQQLFEASKSEATLHTSCYSLGQTMKKIIFEVPQRACVGLNCFESKDEPSEEKRFSGHCVRLTSVCAERWSKSSRVVVWHLEGERGNVLTVQWKEHRRSRSKEKPVGCHGFAPSICVITERERERERERASIRSIAAYTVHVL